MSVIFLILIYAAFISLGLPDSVLGSAWPVMGLELGAAEDFAGYVFMTVAIGTIISSFYSSRLIRRFGTGKVTAFSVLLTACALYGFHLAGSSIWLLALAVPLGLGAGSVDAALNEFIAEHYESRHMSWLHSFWGLGAMTGPIILSRLFEQGKSWRDGYLTVSIIQFTLTFILFLSLPLWKKVREREAVIQQLDAEDPACPPPCDADVHEQQNIGRLLRMRGVVPVLLTVFLYCGVEQTMMLWGASYLIAAHPITPATAAAWISFFLMGITVGRFLSGFVTMKFSNKQMIRFGLWTILVGVILIILPLPSVFLLAGILLAGLGCAPIYPCMLHETPVRFGKGMAQEVMGIQMAFAYAGSTLIPPLVGALAARTTMRIIPGFLLAFGILMLITNERVNQVFSGRQA